MRAFVYQAYVQAGGTHMAYHIGRILRQRFGLEVFAVGEPLQKGMFGYPVVLPVVDEAAMIADVAPDDWLICNPSFSSRMFGLRLPCRKLCYVQGVRTYPVLDVFFDHYVFVSKWVRWFVERYYGIDGPVIPAFIDTEIFHARSVNPPRRRRAVCAVMARKHDPLVLERLARVYAELHGGATLPVEIIPIVPQAELARKFRACRVFLGLDVMEGFGLPMLEAMACGCAAVGWDSGGGGEYARSGYDALLARYGDLAVLARLLHLALHDDDVADALGDRGMETGAAFGPERFERAWTDELSRIVVER